MLTDEDLERIAKFLLEPTPEDVSFMAKELLRLRAAYLSLLKDLMAFRGIGYVAQEYMKKFDVSD